MGNYPADLLSILAAGKYAVIPTDTIYGIVCSALNKEAVEKLYVIRKRDTSKPCIVLISDVEQLKLFNIPFEQYKDLFHTYWPGPTSIIVPCHENEYAYLHRGSQAIAFRLPDTPGLQELIGATGPLLAPSANLEGLPPATTIEEAKQYFDTQVELYVDGGTVIGSPSAIIEIGQNGLIKKIR